jgi:hypothetical protein
MPFDFVQASVRRARHERNQQVTGIPSQPKDLIIAFLDTHRIDIKVLQPDILTILSCYLQ